MYFIRLAVKIHVLFRDEKNRNTLTLAVTCRKILCSLRIMFYHLFICLYVRI